MPIYQSVGVGCFLSMMGATLPKGGVEIRAVHGRSDIESIRNKLAKVVADGEHEFSMWVDSDITFPVNGIMRLFGEMERRSDAGVMTGLYRGRRPPNDIVCFQTEIHGDKSGYVPIQVGNVAHLNLLEIDACGAGFMMVRNEVFRQGARFSKVNGLSEDLSFCHSVKSLGWKVYAVPSIRCGHETFTTLEV